MGLKLNALDRVIGWFAPAAAVRRGLARRVLAEYEGGKPSRLRRAMRDDRAPNQLVGSSAIRLRNYARHQERNLDILRGALGVLVQNVVGPQGISIEPMPMRHGGREVHQDFADQLMRLFADWRRRPEVTWTMDWAGTQRQACRSWLRDGEEFTQLVEGTGPLIDHGTLVPFSLELIEADFVPLDFEDRGRQIRQGVELNAWQRARAFHVWKGHPNDAMLFSFANDLKRIPAERMLHLAMRDRLHQLRGISVFASVINRMEDLKEYEDSERVAAKIAAALPAVITRDGDVAGADPGALAASSSDDRARLRIEAGTVWDGAPPGAKVEILENNRPNPQIESFRSGQLRAAAAGIGMSHSSLARNYDGTYSAQRQELVESWPAYQILTAEFVHQFVRPVWERFVHLAVLAGRIQLPADLDTVTMTAAEFIGPAMPWIDPVKESQGERTRIRMGQKSLTKSIRERGDNPWQTFRQIADERAYARELGITLDSDPAHELGGDAPAGDPNDDNRDPADEQPGTRKNTSAAPRAN
jgi:lambda family phage portal protein